MITPDRTTRHAPAPGGHVQRRLARALALPVAALSLLALVACVTEPSVVPAVTAVEIAGGDRALEVGESFQLSATVSTVGGASDALSWGSSDEGVAGVDAAGLVTAISVGSTTISATSDFDADVSDSILLEVVEVLVPAVTAVEIAGGDRTLEVGESYQLSATVSTVGGASDALSWGSSDEGVAGVDATGLVTAISVGSTTISATSDFDADVSDSILLEVVEPAAPTPLGFDCQEIPEGAAGPTLLCESEGGEVTVRIPWQGDDVIVSSLPLDGLWGLPAEDDFEPLSDWPLLQMAVTSTASGEAVVAFDPPMELSVRYGETDFDAATPGVDEGELGLGVWDAEQESWIVVGHGVFHEGFWLADPIAGGGIELVPDRPNAQPRFQLTGSPAGGQAISLVAAALPSLPLAWGAMPPDPEHMLKEFDEGCEEVELDVGSAVKCVASMVGLTVWVPVQGDGTVTPRVIALPWNKASTFEVDDEVGTRDEHDGPLIRRLMNFLVVDADTGELLTEFDPPLEFEIAYEAEDKDPDLNPFLGITYWNEYVEQFVLLGGGDTNACTDTYSGATSANCLWGFPEAAGPTSDERFDGLFFLTNPDGLGGIAKFTYDQWGDRMVAMVR